MVLIEHSGKIVGKNELLDAVWNEQFVEEGNLTVNISLLRKALGESKNDHRYIVTVQGSGYGFVAEITKEETDEFFIEHHSLERIFVEEQIKDDVISPNPQVINGNQISPPAAPFLKSEPNKDRLLAFGLIGVLLFSLFGAWIYQRQNHSNGLISKWTNPASEAVKARQLTADGDVDVAALSPDGNFFAYTVIKEGKFSLWLEQIDGNRKFELRPSAGGRYHGLTFSPDNSRIYYVLGNKLYSLPIFGGVPEKILENVHSPVTISPDGKSSAFVRFVEERKLTILIVADLEKNGAEKELAARPVETGFDQSGADWSPDGKTFAWIYKAESDKKSKLTIFPIEGGSPLAKFELRGGALRFTLIWTRDGKSLIYADLNGSLAAEYLRRQASKNPANSRRNYLRP